MKDAVKVNSYRQAQESALQRVPLQQAHRSELLVLELVPVPGPALELLPVQLPELADSPGQQGRLYIPSR